MIETAARGLVAGATGLTGRAVVAELRARGIDAVAHVRPDSSSLERWRAHFTELGAEVDTTAWEQAALTAMLRERAPTMIFALLGTTKKRGRQAAAAGRDASAESYEAVDYGLTAMLRCAAEATGRRPRFVYLSSMNVSETTTNPYLVARVRIERELRHGDLPYTIVRPSWILGDRDERRAGESIGASVTDALLAVAGALGARKTRDRYRSIQADDLARALVRVALDPRAINRVVEADELR